MKKKLLLAAFIPLQLLFIFWVTSCGKAPVPTTATPSSSTIHALDENGCFLNSCFGPPFYTQASWSAYDNGTGPLVPCVPDPANVAALCTRQAPAIFATETATITPQPGTPTPSYTPSSPVPTNTPTDTFTPSPTDTPTPTYTPTPNPCQVCLSDYLDKLKEIALDILLPDQSLLECNAICSGTGDPRAVELCISTCEAASDLLSEIQQGGKYIDAEITLKNCLDTNGCTNDITD